MNLVLCGMMGSGKTTVGKALAKGLSWTLIDTDAIVEERYGKIIDIFEKYGENYFRDRESEVCAQFAKMQSLVLSTGGGVLLRAENVRILKDSGKLVFLRAKKETLLKRLQKDVDRPLLHGSENVEKELENLLKNRTAIYTAVADYIVDVDGKSPEEIAQEIIEKMPVEA